MNQLQAARRRLGGLLRTGGAVLTDTGLEMWREDGAEEWKASAAEIGVSLETLGVPHTLFPARRPSYRSTVRTPPRGTMVFVARADVAALASALKGLGVAKALETYQKESA